MRDDLTRLILSKTDVDGLTLLVLKGHLFLERRLQTIIDLFVHHPERLRAVNLTFVEKVAIARSLSLEQDGSSIWSLILAINTLRNDIAHALDSEKRANRLANLR